MKLPILTIAVCIAAASARAQSVLDPAVWARGEKLGMEIRAVKAKQASRPTQASIALDFDPSVPAEIKSQMRGDMEFASSIRGLEASELHRKIFGQVDGRDYMRFFADRIKSIGMDSCGDALAAVACVRNEYPSTMWVARGYTILKIPQIYRAYVLFHEARHAEVAADGWPHARCPEPFKDANGNDIKGIISGSLLAGNYGCDTTALGAYGAGMVMLKNISKYCENCTGKVKMDAGMFADDLLLRFIDRSAVKTLRDDLYR